LTSSGVALVATSKIRGVARLVQTVKHTQGGLADVFAGDDVLVARNDPQRRRDVGVRVGPWF
jgi:hypothetical protein